MRRLILVTLAVLAVVPPVVGAAQVNASITDVTVSPQSPAPGESIRFTTTVRNLQGSGDAMEISSVELRPATARGLPVYNRVRNVGTLQPGAEMPVPLTHTFGEPGTRDLRVHVNAQNANTNEKIELRYPVSVSVRQRHPQINVQTSDSVVGAKSSGNVTIANGLDTRISNVEVTVSSNGATVLDNRSVFASLEQGATAVADFRFRPVEAGTSDLSATVTYTLPSGTQRRVTQNQTIEAETARGEVVLETSRSGSGTEQTLSVDIINQGNTAAQDIVVTGRSANATVSKTIVDSVPPSSTKQVQLSATLSEPRADVVVSANYESGSVQQTATTSRTLRATPAAIELTGLGTTHQDGILHITGSTSNVGTTTAQSVVIRVVPGENVEPAAPNRDFFVGKVPGSDFSSFDLTARTTGSTSTIRLQVDYLADGEQIKQTFSVPVDSEVTGQSKQQASGGPVVGLVAVLGLGAVAVLVITGILFRRYRGFEDEIDI